MEINMGKKVPAQHVWEGKEEWHPTFPCPFDSRGP